MKLRATIALLAAFALMVGCDVGKTASQASARRVMVATLIQTPEITVPREALAIPIPDAGGFTFDGGLPFDAGFSPFTADGKLLLREETLSFAFFGERQGDGLTQAPVPLDGTTLFVQAGENPRLEMRLDNSTGAYQLSSLDNPAMKYLEGEKYTFTANNQSENYITEIAAVPPHEQIVAFHPPDGFIHLNAGQQFVFVRSDPPENQDRDLGFVTVLPITDEGKRGIPTWTNVPTDAFGLLKLVAAPGAYKRSEVTIPGEAFPDRDSNYLILLQTARLGGPQTANLFIGSAIMAGTAEVGIVKTDP